MPRGRREVVIELAGRMRVAMVVAFMVSLIAAAVFLAGGSEETANSLAEVAYYFLVVAVVSALVEVSLERDLDDEEDGEERGD